MNSGALDRLPKEFGKSIPSEEKICWDGSPDWRSFGYQVFGIKYLFIYFIVTALYAVSQIESSFSFSAFSINYLPYFLSGVFAGSILLVLAYVAARHTYYVITERRIVIRTGVALVFLLNVPFKNILSIDKQVLARGRGNIAFKAKSKKRIPYFSCWPSVRSGSFVEPVPAFRSITDIEHVGKIVANIASENPLEDEKIPTKESVGAVA